MRCSRRIVLISLIFEDLLHIEILVHCLFNTFIHYLLASMTSPENGVILPKIPCLRWVTFLLLFPRFLLFTIYWTSYRLCLTKFWNLKYFFKYIKCPFTFSPSGTFSILGVLQVSPLFLLFCVQSSNLLAPLLDLFHLLYTSNPVFFSYLFIVILFLVKDCSQISNFKMVLILWTYF